MSGAHHNYEAEQALIGAALFEPSLAIREASALRAEHFYEPFHGRLYAAIQEQDRQGRPAEPALLRDRFRNDPAFQELGGLDYLRLLMNSSPPASQARHYAEAVIEQWSRRELVRLASEAVSMVGEGKPCADVVAGLRQQIERLESEASSEPRLISARQAAQRMLAEKEQDLKTGRVRGALTGLDCFDVRLGGLPPGWLVTVGGRPSMGKTALMRSAAYGAALKNPDKLFVVFSIEMDDAELSERAVASQTADDHVAIPTEKIHKGQVAASEFAGLYEAAERLPDNLLIDTRGDLSMDDVRRTVWAVKRRGALGAVFLDYLQLMRRPRAEGRNEASVIGEMTQGLKQLARQARICVVILSQLSRQVEQRDDKRPQLSDLRESGSIEQDSNAVLFPFREAYYLERSEPKPRTPEWDEWSASYFDVRRKMEVFVPKVRQGAIGKELQEYDPEFDRIQNWRGDR